MLLQGDYTNKSISIIIFGVAAFIGGVMTLALPETLGKKLADMVEDTDSIEGTDNKEIDANENMSLNGLHATSV